MKKTYKIQQILLVTNSSLLRGELSNNYQSNKNGVQSAAENVEEACWNGMIDEWLPEVVNTKIDEHMIYVTAGFENGHGSLITWRLHLVNYLL